MVFLQVLKIIGLVLLWGIVGILGLLLITILLVMFVPIRYKAYAEERLGPYEFRINWLLHLISGRLTLDHSMDVKYSASLFGHEIIGEEADKRRLEKEEKRRRKEEKKRKKPGVRKVKAAPEEDGDEPEEKTAIVAESKETDGACDGKETKKEKAPNKFLEKLREFRHNTVDAIKRFFNGLKEFGKKLVKIHDKQEILVGILEDDRLIKNIAWCRKKFKRLIHAIKPKKLKADIRFGFNDPSYTGVLLGVFGFMYTFFGDSLKIEPDFTEACFEAKGSLKGRVYLIVPTLIGLQALFNKDLKYTIERVKSLGGSND